VTPRPTLGQILRPFLAGPSAADLRLPAHQWKTLHALARCRTAALGGQAFYCPHCRREHVVAHSCRNRHCPQCQGAAAVDWLAQQAATLLPVPYFHLVFTLPHALNPLIRQNRAVLFKLLFDAASQTLLEFGAQRLSAQLGITAVLHTWSQTLGDHYHLHGIVTGGGVTLDQSRWVHTAPHYLFPVRALSRMFRGKYLAGLNELFTAGKLEFHGELKETAAPAKFAARLREATQSQWVVYAKRPFAGPAQVLAYLSRYTHRVALSPRRLLAADGATVTFAYKDYADGSRPKTMTLGTAEFVRRFCLHVLPERFVKIRHYGLLGNRRKQTRLVRARALLGAAPVPEPQPLPELLQAPTSERARPRAVRFASGPDWCVCGKCHPVRSPHWIRHEPSANVPAQRPVQRTHPRGPVACGPEPPTTPHADERGGFGTSSCSFRERPDWCLAFLPPPSEPAHSGGGSGTEILSPVTRASRVQRLSSTAVYPAARRATSHKMRRLLAANCGIHC
jgi:hypothetical protein